MHIKDNLTNFLYDQNFFITFYQNNLYFFNFEEILKLSSEEIVLKFADFKVNIKGEHLEIRKMLRKELLISGYFREMRIDE
jgi:hypothetical protein